MKGGIVPHQQETAYQRGYEAGRWYGAFETRGKMGHHLPMGICIGFVLGAVIEPIVRWWLS